MNPMTQTTKDIINNFLTGKITGNNRVDALPLTGQGVRDLQYLGSKKRRNQMMPTLDPMSCNHVVFSEVFCVDEDKVPVIVDVCQNCSAPRLSDRNEAEGYEVEER